MINIALLGFGTVGRGTYNILEKKKKNIEKALGQEVVVKKILEVNLASRPELDRTLFTDNYDEIIEDEEISLIVEMTGAVGASYEFIKKALNAKKHAVTSNKAVVSEYFEEFIEIANKNNVAFLFEAAVGGSIPIITPLRSQSILNDIVRIRAIINGTSNFLLSKMQETKAEYSQILKEAQELGFAEANPYEDVEGVDALRKLRILSTIAYKGTIKNEDILRRGISSINKNDIEYLEKNNLKIKLIAESVLRGNEFRGIVEPVMLKSDDMLYGIDGSENSVEIFGENYGSLVFSGEGAGSLPTGNAIVNDVIDALAGNYYPVEKERELIIDSDNVFDKYYLRVNGKIELKEEWIESKEEHSDFNIIMTKELKRSELVNKIEELGVKDEDYFLARIN